MNLVKWLRKNNMKVMAVVVVILMIAFIGGSALNYLLSPTMTLGYKAVAYFGNNRKIKSSDLSLARQELEILKLLGAYDLLRAQDLRGFLLAELLFSEGRPPTALINQLEQAIRSSRYIISDKQIYDIYKRSMPNHIYWLLLKKEAQLAGIRVKNNEVGELLGRAIPQLFDGQTYTQRIGMLMNRYGIPEDQLLETFGKLLAVLEYANLVCSTEDVTVSQVRWLASCEKETIDVEFVKFDSAVFTKTVKQPSEEQILDQFNKYKETFAGDISEENPYGFGYKLPDRVQLEYMAVKLDDISSIVTPPTFQEMEDYYRIHKGQFTESVPEDPNDPNSPLVERTRSYADVASLILKQLTLDKINSKAENILQEAKAQAEANPLDIEAEDLNAEQLKSPAVGIDDYNIIATKLAEKYKIKIYTGKTGLLSGADMDADEYLRRFYMLGPGRSPVRLRQIVFSINELQVGQDSLGPLNGQSLELFESIGPVRDLLAKVMLLIRVTKAEKASAPERVDQTFSEKTVDFGQKQTAGSAAEDSKDIYSVKREVVKDLKKLAVIDKGLVKSKAEEFIAMAAKNGWEKTINKFNKLYGEPSTNSVVEEPKQGESEPNVFGVEHSTNLRRIPRETLLMLETQSEGTMGERLFVPEAQKWLSVNGAEIQSRFIAKLYSLVPQNSSTVNNLPLLMEFKPEMSFYVIKNILIKRLSSEEFEKIRTRTFFKEDQTQSQSMAPVHFNPENILKRMNFRLAKQSNETETKSEDAS